MQDLFNSQIGRKFIEWTMPEFVSELSKLNNNIERLIEVLDNKPKDNADINKNIREGIEIIVRIRNEGIK